MLTSRDILALVTAAVASGVVLFLINLRRSGQPPRGASLDGALGLGVGYLAGHLVLRGWPSLPPLDATDWVFWLASGGVLVGFLEIRFRRPPVLPWLFRALISGLTPWLVLSPLAYLWSGPDSTGAFWVIGLAPGILIWWALLAPVARKQAGALLLLSLWLAASGTSIAIALTGAKVLGMKGGVVAAALGAMVFFQLWKPWLFLAPGLLAVMAPVLSALLLCGTFYSELPRLSALLLALSPVGGQVGELRACRNMGPLTRVFLGLAAVGIPILIALLLCWDASPSFGDYEDY